MKWKSIFAARGGRTFSIRHQTGNEFTAATTPSASVRRITANRRPGCEVGGTTSQDRGREPAMPAR
ncbi:hypothetical protein AC630_03250 [Bradyrhizobium sp. AS23.2]|nr:hypothetical protein AC630_03250 [Bradyrhizobium sp. AS23.2]